MASNTEFGCQSRERTVDCRFLMCLDTHQSPSSSNEQIHATLSPVPTANFFSFGAHLTQVADRLIRSNTSDGFHVAPSFFHTYALRSNPHVTIVSLLGAQSTPV